MSSSFRIEVRPRAGEVTKVLLAEPPPWWVATLALAGALLLQSTVAPLLGFRGGVVSIVALVTMWFALRSRPASALAFGAFIGAGDDALGTTGAAWTIATALVAWTLSRVRGHVPVDRPALVLVAIASATLARSMLALATLALEGRPLAGIATHLHAALWQGLLTALAGTALLLAVPRLGGARGRY